MITALDFEANDAVNGKAPHNAGSRVNGIVSGVTDREVLSEAVVSPSGSTTKRVVHADAEPGEVNLNGRSLGKPRREVHDDHIPSPYLSKPTAIRASPFGLLPVWNCCPTLLHAYVNIAWLFWHWYPFWGPKASETFYFAFIWFNYIYISLYLGACGKCRTV